MSKLNLHTCANSSIFINPINKTFCIVNVDKILQLTIEQIKQRIKVVSYVTVLILRSTETQPFFMLEDLPRLLVLSKSPYKHYLEEFYNNVVLVTYLNKHDNFLKETKIMNTAITTNNKNQTFHNDLFGDLTILTHSDGSIWFIGKEIAEKLGYTNPNEAIRTHCKGVSEFLTPTKGGNQTVKIIPERDVYRLIMKSKLPTAEKFEEWIVSEVLPSIRKTGGYGQAKVENKTAKPKSYLGNASLVRLVLKEVHAMKLSEDSKQTMIAHVLHEHAGLPLSPMLPVINNDKLSPEEIGKQLGVSAQLIGRIITKLNLRGNDEYCEARLSKSRYGDKQVPQYFYSKQAIELIKKEIEAKQ